VRRVFLQTLVCPSCLEPMTIDVFRGDGEIIEEGALGSACGRRFPVIASVPRILPEDLATTLARDHADFFRRHEALLPRGGGVGREASKQTLHAFGEEWQRFPELLEAHQGIFEWYFEGGGTIDWCGKRVLDAGCGMGRWLHFASRAGAQIVGMDVSPAVDVAAARERDADFVQADLRWPPFAPSSFDLVYSLGVLHHLEHPPSGIASLAPLVRPGGELRIYVYRSLNEEPLLRRALLGLVTLVRGVTRRLPFFLVHAFAWVVAGVATILFLVPRRLLRRSPRGDRLTRGLPLVQYTDVPFRMLVSEQFDRFVAPLEGRHERKEIEGWLLDAGFQVVELLEGLGWRAIGRRPS